jgi:hypothetical protein
MISADSVLSLTQECPSDDHITPAFHHDLDLRAPERRVGLQQPQRHAPLVPHAALRRQPRPASPSRRLCSVRVGVGGPGDRLARGGGRFHVRPRPCSDEEEADPMGAPGSPDMRRVGRAWPIGPGGLHGR